MMHVAKAQDFHALKVMLAIANDAEEQQTFYECLKGLLELSSIIDWINPYLLQEQFRCLHDDLIKGLESLMAGCKNNDEKYNEEVELEKVNQTLDQLISLTTLV